MSEYKFIDLSQPLFNGIPLATILPRFHMYPCLELRTADTVNCNAALITDHTGTHCDAPCHVLADGKSIDQLPVDAFSGKAICLDVREHDGCAITIEIIEEAEKKAARKIQEGDIVLFNTDHSKLWGPIPEGYAYLKNRAWLDPHAAEYLVSKKIKAIGIDLGGPDPLGGSKHICHEILLSNDVYIIESLCNLDQIVGKEVTFLAFPLKFQGFSGAPTRAVAMVEQTI